MPHRLPLTLLLCAMLSACALTPPAPSSQPLPVSTPPPGETVPVATYPSTPAVPALTTVFSPNDETERAALARIEHELALLERYATDAERTRDTSAPVAFDYLSLRRDLELIRSGVRTHLLGPTRAPRAFAPLRGDYR